MLMESWDVKRPLFGETAGTPSVPPPLPACQRGEPGEGWGHCLGSAIHQIWREPGGLATCAKSCYTLLSCSPIFPQLVCMIRYWLVSVFSVGMQQLLRICSCYGVQLDILFSWNNSVILIVQTKGELWIEFKCLGHIIRDDLCNDDDIQRQCCKLYAQANMLAQKGSVFFTQGSNLPWMFFQTKTNSTFNTNFFLYSSGWKMQIVAWMLGAI